MITMRIKGGLGNQLFQYAATYSLSKRLNQPFQFNPAFTPNMTVRGYKLPELNVDVDTVVRDDQIPGKIRWIKNFYINKAFRVLNLSKYKSDDFIYWIETKDEWQPEFFTIDEKNIYVDGYFQSEMYFKHHREELLRQFSPRYVEEAPYTEALTEIMKCNAVAIHMRRSDFRRDKKSFHYLLDADYYQKAIVYMRNNLNNPTFFWFSDDMDWVKAHMGKELDFRFLSVKTNHGDIDDMMLMKNCKHIITANSTYSWWAAWLNEHTDAVRIVPAKPYGMDGMIPESWIKM